MIRLTCLIRSLTRALRSRTTRRLSSSSGVGTRSIAQTRGSPRLWASKALTSVSPSIRSVFARRRRRETAIEAGSTTWLSIPLSSRTRWIQKPSRPASWIEMIRKLRPVLAVALRCRCSKCPSKAGTSPPGTTTFDIFSPAPGESDVIIHFDRESSRETKMAARSVRTATGLSTRLVVTCMLNSEWGDQPWQSRGRSPHHGIFTATDIGRLPGSGPHRLARDPTAFDRGRVRTRV